MASLWYLNTDSDDEVERYESRMFAQAAKSRTAASLARPLWEPPPTECSFDVLQSWHGLSRDASRVLCPFCNRNVSAAHFCGLSSDGSSHIAQHGKQLSAIGERYERLATYVRLVIQYCSPYHRKMLRHGCQEKPGQWRPCLEPELLRMFPGWPLQLNQKTYDWVAACLHTRSQLPAKSFDYNTDSPECDTDSFRSGSEERDAVSGLQLLVSFRVDFSEEGLRRAEQEHTAFLLRSAEEKRERLRLKREAEEEREELERKERQERYRVHGRNVALREFKQGTHTYRMPSLQLLSALTLVEAGVDLKALSALVPEELSSLVKQVACAFFLAKQHSYKWRRLGYSTADDARLNDCDGSMFQVEALGSTLVHARDLIQGGVLEGPDDDVTDAFGNEITWIVPPHTNAPRSPPHPRARNMAAKAARKSAPPSELRKLRRTNRRSLRAQSARREDSGATLLELESMVRDALLYSCDGPYTSSESDSGWDSP